MKSLCIKVSYAVNTLEPPIHNDIRSIGILGKMMLFSQMEASKKSIHRKFGRGDNFSFLSVCQSVSLSQ